MAPVVKGAAVAAASFLLLGTVAALWENPVFIRMTPAGDLEIILLGAMSALLGVYVAVRRPACSIRTAGTGGRDFFNAQRSAKAWWGFGSQRIRVSPDSERGFALEGVAVLDLMHPVRGAGDPASRAACIQVELPLAA